MARGNYPVCKNITLVHEGGTSNNKFDPGGFTSRGVTAGAGAEYRKRKGLPAKAVDKWTAAEVDRFYQDDYWLAVNAEMLPYGVDLATFDSGVNSGPSRGAKWLQRAAGVKQDGKVGQGTLRAVAADDGDKIVRLMCGYRLSFVQGLGTFKVFGKGWSRRIADIEARGVTMWLRYGAGKSAGDTADELARQAEAANEKAGQSGKAATGTGAGGAGLGVTDAVQGGTVWLLIGAGLLVLIAAGLVLRSRQHTARAEAYAVAADEMAADEMRGV